jgi:hypothetical protein
VKATLELRAYRNPVEAVEEVKFALDAFLNPVTGGFNNNGYEFGELPDKTKIMQVLYDLPWVDEIKELKLHITQKHTDENLKRFIAVIPGQHNINIEFQSGDGQGL